MRFNRQANVFKKILHACLLMFLFLSSAIQCNINNLFDYLREIVTKVTIAIFCAFINIVHCITFIAQNF